jgi:hypothetical protein
MIAMIVTTATDVIVMIVTIVMTAVVAASTASHTASAEQLLPMEIS